MNPLLLEVKALKVHFPVNAGLFTRAWDGTEMSQHQAGPGLLRTDAATVELFAWLAVDGPAG